MSSAILTSKMRFHNAQQFKKSFSETDNFYLYIAKVSPWTDESNPPNVQNTLQTEVENWFEMIGGKKIGDGNVINAIRRVDWTDGESYVRWDDSDDQIFEKNFYVMTDDYNVYKCIDNNNGDISLNKPTGTGTSIITLADGYKWKFMYQLSVSNATKFMTDDWLPVQTLSSDDGSFQWSVQENAIDGAIHTVRVVNGGSGYSSAPTVSVNGDGIDFAATAHMNAGSVDYIEVTNPGSGYTWADITVSGGSPTSAASLEPIWSPNGGHGSDAIEELGGYYVMLLTRLEYDEGGKLPTTNQFRKIGIMKNPKQHDSDSLYTGNAFNQTTVLDIDSGYSGSFEQDEIVTGASSSAEAKVVSFDTASNELWVNNVKGDFSNGENISTSSGDGTIGGITDPDLKALSGSLLYIENRKNTERASDQIEDIKVITEH